MKSSTRGGEQRHRGDNPTSRNDPAVSQEAQETSTPAARSTSAAREAMIGNIGSALHISELGARPARLSSDISARGVHDSADGEPCPSVGLPGARSWLDLALALEDPRGPAFVQGMAGGGGNGEWGRGQTQGASFGAGTNRLGSGADSREPTHTAGEGTQREGCRARVLQYRCGRGLGCVSSGTPASKAYRGIHANSTLRCPSPK